MGSVCLAWTDEELDNWLDEVADMGIPIYYFDDTEEFLDYCDVISVDEYWEEEGYAGTDDYWDKIDTYGTPEVNNWTTYYTDIVIVGAGEFWYSLGNGLYDVDNNNDGIIDYVTWRDSDGAWHSVSATDFYNLYLPKDEQDPDPLDPIPLDPDPIIPVTPDDLPPENPKDTLKCECCGMFPCECIFCIKCNLLKTKPVNILCLVCVCCPPFSLCYIRNNIEIYIDAILSLVGLPYIYGTNGPDSYDCSGAVCYGLRQINPNFGDYSADELFNRFTFTTLNNDAGTLVFYDFESDGIMEHVTTLVGGENMVHPSSGSKLILNVSEDYLDNYTTSSGGKKYYRDINWFKVNN